jgi:DNA-directed RNA polymerase subunit L
MNIEHPSEFCQAAILIYYIQSTGPHTAEEALLTTLSEHAEQVERFRAQLISLFGDATEMQVKLNGGC